MGTQLTHLRQLSACRAGAVKPAVGKEPPMVTALSDPEISALADKGLLSACRLFAGVVPGEPTPATANQSLVNWWDLEGSKMILTATGKAHRQSVALEGGRMTLAGSALVSSIII